MTRTFVLAALAASTLAVAVACSGSDAPIETPANDGGAASTSSTSSSGDVEEDAGPVDRYEEREDQGTGVTFSDLYRDFLGPTGKASCAGSDGLCHGGPEKAGALGSSGFVCGADKDACYAAMTGKASLVTSQDATEPTKSTLYLVVRHRRPDGSLVGNMPKRPVTYVFSTASMERIATWIKNGANND